MKLQLVRPKLSEDKETELGRYLLDHFDRAQSARKEQVDNHYLDWTENYYGVPAETIRSVPWYKSSNFVVKLTRIFLDTFLARTLNMIFATRPLYRIEGFPRDLREGLEYYINQKALRDWDHYALAKDFIHRGNKNGTVFIKTPWVEIDAYNVRMDETGRQTEEKIITFSGPQSRCIPYEDFCCYPSTATRMEDLIIKFHTVRYVEEVAKRKRSGINPTWMMTEEELNTALMHPKDIKRDEMAEEAGVVDPYLRELQVVECYLQWPITNDPDKYYDIVAVICPAIHKLIDCYFNPYPGNMEIFQRYAPFPKEDLIYGESLCEILEQAQEEVSCIHNERRNNSTLANTVMFKRKSGSNTPNPSTNWYPGKVWDVESMDDLDVMTVGRSLTDNMMAEENFGFQLSQQLTGTTAEMQGMGSGSMGKKGMYNTGGTLAVLSEGTQRQDTNIRDVRGVLSAVAKCCYIQQRAFGSDDPLIGTLPDKLKEQVQAALAAATPDRMRLAFFDAKVSDAGANKEVKKANLMNIAQVLGQYGQSVTQMSMQLANPGLNPIIRSVMMQTIEMQRAMAVTLLRAFDEMEMEDVLPDVENAITAAQSGGGQAAPGGGPGGNQGGPQQGGSPSPGPGGVQSLLSNIASLPPTNGGPPQ